MSSCLICNNYIIQLLDLNLSTFNYCQYCFHCQIDIDEHSDFYNCDKSINYEDHKSIKKLISDLNCRSDETLLITNTKFKFNYLQDFDQTLLQDFLNTEFQYTYKKIIFYKTFDRTREIKNILEYSKSILKNEIDSEIIIFTSTENVISKKKYSSLNQNIISYFCINSMKTLCEQFNLTINSIEKSENHSIYKIHYKKRDEIGCSNDLISKLYSEIESNLYDDKTYILFNLYGLFLQADMKRQLTELNIKRMENLEKNEQHFIIGWIGNNNNEFLDHSINLINFCELNSDYIDYILSYELDSNIFLGNTDIKIHNYWELLKHDNSNKIYGSHVTIINFTNSRINDSIYTSFITLYGNNIKIIDTQFSN